MDLNIGLIGAGSIGLVHLLSLKNIISNKMLSESGVNVKIKGIADVDEKKIQNLKRNNPYNVDIFTTNPDELIKDKTINVIYITTPTKFHKEYYFKIAEEGKHVFCEKPLAFSLVDIREMIAQEKKYGIFSQVGLVLRHCPVIWKLKQVFSDKKDELGKKLSFIFRDVQEWPIGTRDHPSEWRKDPFLARAGCLFEHSIHDVDMLEYFFGDDLKLSNLFAKIRHVSPLTQNRLEDVATLNFEYNEGFVGNLTSIWNQAKIDERRIEIFFENGFLLLDGYDGFTFKKFEYLIKRKKTRLKVNDIFSEYLKKMNYPQMTPSTGPYLFENLSFLKSIIAEKKPYPGLEIGLRAHEIIELAYQSSKEDKKVFVNNEFLSL
ncbi:MAG: Gfo/Idh/MocA family protein [Promethearchaeota archaeon]